MNSKGYRHVRNIKFNDTVDLDPSSIHMSLDLTSPEVLAVEAELTAIHVTVGTTSYMYTSTWCRQKYMWDFGVC